MVEYWAHVQAFMPVDLWPVMQHRMAGYREQRGKWGFVADPALEPAVLAAVRERGPVTARDLEEEFAEGPRTREHWGWNWSQARKVLDYLFLVGDVAIAGRTSQFEVLYDVPERVLPAAVLAAPTPTRAEADLELVRRAARSHGVATLPLPRRLLPDVGRRHAGRRRHPRRGRRADPGAPCPAGRAPPTCTATPGYRGGCGARALLSPFDPVVWERSRAETLFDFSYRIEIYVPADKRRPRLLRAAVPARRPDRRAGRPQGRPGHRPVLLVQGAYAEPAAPPETAEELAAELGRLAGWLGLDEVVVGERGDLAPALAAVAAAAGRRG